jgi:predicted RNA binding protein with dsRBD fold (UPF0201 family)
MNSLNAAMLTEWREAVLAAIKNLFNTGMTMTLQDGLKMEAETEFTITDTNERLKKFVKKKK